MATPLAFPHPELTPIPGIPDRKSIALVRQQLNANALSQHSNRGNGALGLLHLTVSDATYLARSGNIPFIAPVHPGPQPVIHAEATQFQIIEANRQYLANVTEIGSYTTSDTTMKHQLIAAINPTYIDCLKDKHIGFANVTILDILNHLEETYGEVTPEDLTANIANLNRQWSPDQPIEDVWKQVDDAITFAEDHDPISGPTAVRAAVDNLDNSGVFSDAIKKFRRQPNEYKTLANLKADINKANKERLRKLTATNAGFHSAAAAAIKPPATTLAPPAPTTEPSLPGYYYCWSHGLGKNPEHTGMKCKNPVAGHCKEATLGNMMGGCNYIARPRTEKPIWKRPAKPDE
jgi:hypothetical protein